MIKQTLMCGLLLGGAMTVLSAPFREADVAANAKWVVHCDFAGLRESQTRHHLLAEFTNPTNEAHFATLKRVWGFDPRTDLDSCTLYGASAAPADAVIILRGRPDTERSVAVFKASPSYRVEPHGSLAVHHWTDPGGQALWLCSPDPDTVVLARQAGRAHEALEVLLGKAPALKLPETGSGSAAHLFAFVALKSLDSVPPKSVILQHAENASLALTEEHGQVTVAATLNATNAAAADRLAAMVRGLLATMELSAAAQPEAPARAQAQRFSQSFSVHQQGGRLTVASQIAALDLLELIAKRSSHWPTAGNPPSSSADAPGTRRPR